MICLEVCLVILQLVLTKDLFEKERNLRQLFRLLTLLWNNFTVANIDGRDNTGKQTQFFNDSEMALAHPVYFEWLQRDDLKILRQENDLRKFGRTQAALMRALWPLLKPGGKMLYATCSVFPEENQLQISAFNAALPEAKLLKQMQLLPDSQHDGFFYALLEKPLA